MARPIARSWMVAACSAVAVCALPSPAQADVTRSQAARKALTALDARKGDAGLVVFGLRAPVRAGAVVTEAGPGGKAKAARSAKVQARLARAGVKAIRPGAVLRAGAPSWLFYADQGPNQAFEHPGKVVLVDRATGDVTVSRALRWVPLVDGRRPAFFRSAAAYQDKRYRVFDRPWKRKLVAPAARAAAVSPEAQAAQQRLADAMAAQRSCALRVSDSLGDFYDFGRVDKTRASLGRLFKSLSALNPGFVSQWYKPSTARTPAEAAHALIAGGCRDLFLYVAGGSTRDGDMIVGVRSGAAGALEWHVIRAAEIEALVQRHPGVTFKLVFDVPFGGAIARQLVDERNVSVLLTAGGADEPSFSYLPQILGPDGLQRNTANPFQLLEFTNTLIRGMEEFVTDPEEIDRAIAEQAAGRSDSVLAWSLARALELGPSPFSDWLLGERTNQRVPDTTVAARPPVNRAPVATTPPQVTREDTAENVTLTALDLDRDPLTFAVVAPPAHGTLTGTAPFLRYTPERDFFGTDQLTYTVSDGRGGTDTATVTIVVSPDNDLPSVIFGPSSAPPVFTENGAPVTVDAGLNVLDIDSARLTGARIEIASGFAAGDQLAFTPAGGVAGAYDAARGVLTLSGTAPVTAYRAALRSVTFGSSGDDPGTARTIRFRADDAEENGVAASRAVTVVPANDAPEAVVPGARTVAEDTALTLGGGDRVAFADADAGAGPVRVELTATHGTLTLAATAGLTFATGDGTADATLAVTGAPAAVNAALDGLVFTPAADFAGAARLDVAVDDLGHTGGAHLTDTASVAIDVTEANDLPVNTVPGAQTLAEDVRGTLTGTFAVADADAGTDPVTTTLALPGARVEVDATGAASVTGNGTASVTIAGTLAEVNAALATVKAQGEQDASGARTLTMTTSDGAGSDTDTVAVTITAVNDAPVIARPAGTQSTLEDTPLPFDSALAVSDVDAAAADVEVGLAVALGTLSAGTTLPGLTVTGDGTGAVTLTGTVAEVGDALDGLVWTPPADGETGTTLSVDVSDLGNAGSGGAQTADEDIAIDVIPVNDVPVLGLAAGDLAWTEGDPAVALDPALTLSDADDAELAAATVTIGGHRAGDALTVTPSPAVASTYHAGSGTLTLTGNGATAADVQAALRTVAFAHHGDAPGTSRTLTVTAEDADGASTPRSRALAITPVNDAPAIDLPAGTTTFTEGTAAGVPVVPSADLGDADDAELEGATIAIGAGRDAARDVLTFTPQDGIAVASWTPATGTLALTGAATVAEYEAALAAVRFRTSGDDPSTATRAVAFTVTDGDATSAAATRDVAVTAVNDAPVVTTTAGDAAWTEGQAAALVDADIDVADADDTDLESATVSITAGRHAADALTFAPVTGLTAAYDGATGVLTVTGAAPATDYETFLRGVRFSNPSGSPSGATRTIAFGVDDGDDASAPATRDVDVTEVNAAPSVDASAGAAAFTENGAPVAVDPGVAVADPDGDPLSGATVQITANFVSGEDELALPAPLHGVTATAFDTATGVLELSGEATAAQYEDVLRSITFASGGDTPDPATRTVVLTVTDTSGADGSDSRGVTVAAANDAPAVTLSGAAPDFTEDGTPVAVDGGLAVADADDADLEGATIEITAGGHAGDALAFTPGAGIADTDPAAGVLALSGTATKAQWQAVLRTVTLATTDQAPAGPRTVRVVVTDGDDPSAAQTKSVAVTAVNDAPVLGQPAATLTSTENDPATVVAPGLTVADADSATLGGATVAITAGHAAEDVLSVSGPLPGGITFGYDADTGVATLGGSATVAQYRDALRAVRYENTSDAPSAASRTVTFRADDGAAAHHASNAVTRTVAVVPVNDAPDGGADTFTGGDGAVGNTLLVVNDPTDGAPGATAVARKTVTGDLLANDTDPDGPIAVVPATLPTSDGGTVTLQADGDFTYDPAVGTGCTDPSDQFTYTLTDGAAQDTATVTIGLSGCVWYVSSDAAGNAGTSTAPFDTLGQARTASLAGHTTFVLRGDGTPYDAGAGYLLDNGERLIGEAAGLSVGGATLAPAAPAQRPTLAAVAADVVQLEDGNTVRGLEIDPQGAGGAIFGGTGDVAGTIDDVVIRDLGTTATQPGLELVSTTGTWDVTGLTVATTGATGVRLSNAGTVDFGTTKVTTSGTRALDLQGTNMGTSQFDEVVVTGSSSGGVYMNSTTGSVTYGDESGTDLSLTTTSGSTPAFRVNNGGTITVGPGGTDTLSSTGGPAILSGNVNATYAFDSLNVTSSDSHGIYFVNSNGAFSVDSAASAILGGPASPAVDIKGGRGDFTFPGSIGGTGGTAYIENRTQDTVTLSGPINDTSDAGGSIDVVNNTGGTIRFTGPVKTIDTGALMGVNVANNTGATVEFTGGGLAVTTTSARALNVEGGGTVTVAGAGNRLTSTTAEALSVTGTTIGAADMTFQSISSNGAPSGVVLNGTGNQGGLAVTGNGGTCTVATPTCTGGQILASTGAGLTLTDVGGGVDLTRVRVNAGLDDGIRATSVAGLTLDTALVTANGNAAQERGIDGDNVTGQSRIASSVLSGSFTDNARIDNDSGTLDLDVTGSTVTGALNGDGIQFYGDGAATMKADVVSSTFSANKDDGFQLVTTGGGAPTMNLNFNSNQVSADASHVSAGALVTLNPGGTSTTKVAMAGNTLTTAKGSTLILAPAGTSQFDAVIQNNSFLNAGGVGVWGNAAQNATARMRIANNIVQGYASNGMYLSHAEGGGTAHYTVTGNTVNTPKPNAFEGLIVEAGALTADTVTVCADVSGNDLGSSGGTGSGGIDIGHARYANSHLRLPGLGAMSPEAYFQSRNTGGPTASDWGPLAPTDGAPCAAPAAPPVP